MRQRVSRNSSGNATHSQATNRKTNVTAASSGAASRPDGESEEASTATTTSQHTRSRMASKDSIGTRCLRPTPTGAMSVKAARK